MDAMATWLPESRRRRSTEDAFRASLVGLDGVHVEVEPINADTEHDGLTRNSLRAEAEAAVREAGMAVYTPAVLAARAPGKPKLHVDVMTIRLDGRYAYSVRLELWQTVALMRAPSIVVPAPAWSARQVVGTVAAKRLADIVETVRSEVGAFALACREARP
jgi:hypothetical protein